MCAVYLQYVCSKLTIHTYARIITHQSLKSVLHEKRSFFRTCQKICQVERQKECQKMGRRYARKQDGAHEPECKHICQTTVYRKRHSRLDYLFHIPVRCWTSRAGDSTTKAACAGDFTTKLRLRHEGSSFCIQIKHWRKGSGRST